MQRRVASASGKDEPESAYGRRSTTLSRTSRDELLRQVRQARRRLLGGTARR